MKYLLTCILFVSLNLYSLNPNFHEETENQIPLEKVENKSDRFFGFASFYNSPKFAVLSEAESFYISNDNRICLKSNEVVAIIKRKEIRIFKPEAVCFEIDQGSIIFDEPKQISYNNINDLDIEDRRKINLQLSKIEYSDIFFPINLISHLIDDLIMLFYEFFNSWGVSIFFLAFTIKVILFPVSILHLKAKKKSDDISRTIKPELEKIKEIYRGEDAHNRILAKYKDLGISQNYAVYPSILALLQIPFLLGVFKVLGEMNELFGASFLWIDDLSKPDAFMNLNESIYFFGNSINILPLMMSFMILTTGYLLIEEKKSNYEVNKTNRNNILIAVLFLIVFYSFPSAMVFYWTASVFFSFLQQRFLFKKV
tara:strand:- start:4579 stop:5685 length:1107 start_codon:yes stop_codon:yes gene_type:complete